MKQQFRIVERTVIKTIMLTRFESSAMVSEPPKQPTLTVVPMADDAVNYDHEDHTGGGDAG
jgi:hypothetical protein